MHRIYFLLVTVSIILLTFLGDTRSGLYVAGQLTASRELDVDEDIDTEDYLNDSAAASSSTNNKNKENSENKTTKEYKQAPKREDTIIESLFGRTLYTWKSQKEIEEVPTQELLKNVQVIGVYFSASWWLVYEDIVFF